MSYAAPYREEPGKVFSGIMAVAVHLLFFALLVFGVTWQKQQPQAVVVDLWNNLPPVSAPKPQPEPAPQVAKPPPQPAIAKPAPKPEPQNAKPDIALKDKLEKEKIQKEQLDKERRAQEDKLKREARMRDEEKKKLAALQVEQTEKARLAKEQDDAMRRLQESQGGAQTRMLNDYMARIHDKIKRRINNTPCASLGNPEILVDVTLLPDGNVLNEPVARKSSGASACDNAILKAVLLAQPLPMPPDPQLLAKFRELNLKFRPNE
jgi:colicin import membrane protein